MYVVSMQDTTNVGSGGAGVGGSAVTVNALNSGGTQGGSTGGSGLGGDGVKNALGRRLRHVDEAEQLVQHQEDFAAGQQNRAGEVSTVLILSGIKLSEESFSNK